MYHATFEEGGSPELKPPSLLEDPLRVPILLFAALSLEAALVAQEQERKIQRSELPAAVEKIKRTCKLIESRMSCWQNGCSPGRTGRQE